MTWSTPGEQPGNPSCEPYLKWLGDVAAEERIPDVFSMSYQDYEHTTSPIYMERVSDELAKLGLRGTTVITGSGDWGVGCNANATRFLPDFPSSSPYIVSAGSTTFCTNTTGPECSLSGVYPMGEAALKFSSGGFSNVFTAPSCQQRAIASFLSKTNVSSSFFNSTGRGFPDISTLGVHFEVVVAGGPGNIAGTSASTPTFAAMVSLLNEARAAAGRPSMGWILPFLYSAAENGGFTDIVEGSNPKGKCKGFEAIKGWDPVTGLGTPRFETLLELAMKQEAWGLNYDPLLSHY